MLLPKPRFPNTAAHIPQLRLPPTPRRALRLRRPTDLNGLMPIRIHPSPDLWRAFNQHVLRLQTRSCNASLACSVQLLRLLLDLLASCAWLPVIDLVTCAFSSDWWREAGSDCRNHLTEPVEVQDVECEVCEEVGDEEPDGDVLLSHESIRAVMQSHISRINTSGKLPLLAENAGMAHSMPSSNGGVEVLCALVGGVRAPADAAEEERESEQGAVDGLIDGTSEVKLIAEPVDVEEGRAELVEEEDGAVEVDEWTLLTLTVSRNIAAWNNARREVTTHVSQSKHTRRRDSMRQHAPTKDLHVIRAHEEIPHKVPQRETLT